MVVDPKPVSFAVNTTKSFHPRSGKGQCVIHELAEQRLCRPPRSRNSLNAF